MPSVLEFERAEVVEKWTSGPGDTGPASDPASSRSCSRSENRTFHGQIRDLKNHLVSYEKSKTFDSKFRISDFFYSHKFYSKAC